MGDFGGKLHLVVLAGGKGVRAGGATPKQFRPTGQGVLFAVSLARFLKSGAPVGSVTVTVPEQWRELAAGTLSGLAGLPWRMADAGESRTRSTWNALTSLAELNPQPSDLVAIHDAARPFATAELLLRLVEAAALAGGAVPGIPVTDTIVDRESGYLDRSRLVAVQTPQVFRWGLLHAAHGWAAAVGAEFTDDGGLLAARGSTPTVVKGDPGNWKITTESDWLRAEDLLNND